MNDTQLPKRIADASAISVLVTMAATWIVPKGLGMIVSSGFSGYDLMSKGMFWLAVSPLAALICLGVLVKSEVNPNEYEKDRKSLASVRILCAIIGAAPVIYLIFSMSIYDPIRDGGLFGALVPLELGEGIWLNLIAFLVIGVEAYIDHNK